MTTMEHTLGASIARLESRAKVTGTARYAAEYVTDDALYAWPVPAGIARGEITAVHTEAAMTDPAVVVVLTHQNAPRLHPVEDRTLTLLQSSHIAHRGQYIALAVATSLEAARSAAGAVLVQYKADHHDVVLAEDHPGLYMPEEIDGLWPGTREHGDFDTVYATAEIRTDAVYTTPPMHNHPMEPHAATALWDGDALTVYDSNQGSVTVQHTLAQLFGIDAGQVRVVSEHVGGGFGSKGTARPHVVLAAMAARVVGRPVKLAVPRNHMPAVVGHRAPTIQRIRIGAGRDGCIQALAHEVVTCTSMVGRFVEAAALPSRVMYIAPNSRTAHRVTRLDIPAPSWMRAPGECPGMFALESAIDELAYVCGIDPVELRIRNDPQVEPDSGLPFSSRHLTECLREGARRFGWHERDPSPGTRYEGRLLIGSGVAASMYPVVILPSRAEVRADPDGHYWVRVNATDIGTGARTVLAQIAADALTAPLGYVHISIGSTDLPEAPLAGGSSGTASWGWAVHNACVRLRGLIEHSGGSVPAGGLSVSADTTEDVKSGQEYARCAFGAQFAEVQVDTDTAEVRLRRLTGVFAAGRILNARTARSQFIGGMTMGLSMALMEGSTMDPEFGDYAERDFASYHVAVCADVPAIEAHWIDEEDPHLNPMHSKGIGEIGIVGTAAAVANAVHHATGVRVRTLPIRPDTLLPHFA
ncbi:MAG: xanthine dehydrogenase family protein molybdopterin-binding subunit [Streptomycetaceae bacterium]|nr:xanthine dehydrogenase family protein molybdopterin-binding subunit [Streptomycetaceae bacterium]